MRYTIALPKLTVGELRGQRVPVFVDAPVGSKTRVARIEVWIDGERMRVLEAPLLGPG